MTAIDKRYAVRFLVLLALLAAGFVVWLANQPSYTPFERFSVAKHPLSDDLAATTEDLWEMAAAGCEQLGADPAVNNPATAAVSVSADHAGLPVELLERLDVAIHFGTIDLGMDIQCPGLSIVVRSGMARAGPYI